MKIDIDAIVKLYESGLSNNQIFIKTGIPKSTIRHILVRQDVSMRPTKKTPKSKIDNMVRLYESGYSVPVISEKIKIPYTTVLYNLRSRRIQMRGAGQLSPKEWEIRGGRYRKCKSQGYWYDRHNRDHRGRPKKVHIVVMEDYLSYSIPKGYCVHHKDENRDNNDLDNLELMTLSQHASHHGIIRHSRRRSS